VTFSGATIRLLSDSGETTLVGLGYLRSAEDFELIGAGRAPRVDPVGLLESLPEGVVEAAREWERHPVEIDTGVVPGSPAGAGPRPENDPDTQTVTARCRAKATELTATGTKTSFGTVQRMRARYRDQGLWGLVDTRSARGAQADRQCRRASGRRRAHGDRGADRHLDGHRSRVVHQIRDLLDEQHGPGTVELPSQTTLYRLLDTLSTGRHTFGTATTRRTTALKPDRVYTDTTAARPGEEMQMDATPLDVMAVMDDGVLGRAELVLSIANAGARNWPGSPRPTPACIAPTY
jgi:hypothetical protein